MLLPHGPARVKSRDELRENFFRLLRRSFLRARKQGGGLDVYRSCADMAYRLCGEHWAQHTIFPGETALVRRFLAETKLPIANPDAVIQHSLMANPWVPAWFSALQALERHEFAQVCRVTGVERLRAAQDSGRGIVLAHSHTLFVQMFWVWMKHEGIAPGISIWQWAWGRKPEEIRDPKIRTVESARELRAAVTTLRQGGLVHVLADGDKSSQQIVLPFCNRQRGFRTTFAEIAVETNALIVPVDATFDKEGGIHIDIGAPFTESAPTPNRADKVSSLVHQYADHLLALWRRSPGDISWYQMNLHLNFPPLRNAGRSPTAKAP